MTCTCGHGDLPPNFHMTPCPIKVAHLQSAPRGDVVSPLETARAQIAEWLASGSSDGPQAYMDDADELLFLLADHGLTVVSGKPIEAYRAVRALPR